MDSTSQYAVKYDDHPPYGPQQPIGQPYWQADFTPSPWNLVSATFTYDLGSGKDGWGNHELQNYTADPNNSFYRGDKKLVIRAVANNHRPDPFKYTSARLISCCPHPALRLRSVASILDAF
jgi:hypothetical protein